MYWIPVFVRNDGMTTILEVEGLQTVFDTSYGAARAVDGISFSIAEGETLGIVGESGCGKSVTAMSIMRLVPQPPGRVAGGSIRFDGRDLLGISGEEMRRVRGNEIAMIFQEPMTSLNPVFTVGYQVAEAVRVHRNLGKRAAFEEAVRMLELVEIPEARARARDYPHQLSGGMRQRVMIAMALSCRPRLLIADEPTTALDVTIQAQILDLLRSLQQRMGMAMMLITHDLGVVGECADRVIVMYAGKIVEMGSCRQLFERPTHPYTLGLMASQPQLGGEKKRLVPIPGMVPRLTELPAGCSFRDRCSLATGRCALEDPALRFVADGHSVACAVVDGEG